MIASQMLTSPPGIPSPGKRGSQPMRTPIITAALALVTCGGPDITTEAEPLPWIAVLADGALAANEEVFGVVERPVVEVETAPGLERFAADLALVPGAADREARAKYVRLTDTFLNLLRDRLARGGFKGDLPPRRRMTNRFRGLPGRTSSCGWGSPWCRESTAGPGPFTSSRSRPTPGHGRRRASWSVWEYHLTPRARGE